MDAEARTEAWVQETIFRVRCVDFPWDMTRALELALFRTFASPRIGGLLCATGEFTCAAQRRYDDTDLLLSEIVENGYESERGQRALARMNEIHGRFRICNEDFLYVLSTFVLEPFRWIERFGWRQLTEPERDAWFRFWMGVGRRMGITDVPDDVDVLTGFSAAYERENFLRTDATEEVARRVIDLFASWYPAPARPAVRAAIRALLDPPLLGAIGLREAPGWRQSAVLRALGLRAAVVRMLPRRTSPVLRCRIQRRDHPGGYEIEGLGPPPRMG